MSVLHKKHTKQLGHCKRLTNIRYADDLMLFAMSSYDLIYVLPAMIPEFAVCGLQLSSAKAKILTTSPLDSSEFVDVRGETVQVIHAGSVHKYLGRNLGGNLRATRGLEFSHRLKVACNKFHEYKHITKHIFLNTHTVLVVRPKLFDAVVFFGLTTSPLTKVCVQKLGVVQKRMPRCIVWAGSNS